LAYRHHLERVPPGLWRTVSVRQDHHGRRDVRAGSERFRTYGINLDGELKTYAERIWDLPAMQEWREAALAEHEEIEELEAEF
jgi:hypothetical protein